jgi:hypothetical protein
MHLAAMATEIRPSLAQMLNPQAAPTRPAAQPAPQTAQAPGGFAGAMAAQKAFFQQITAPKIAPANYTAADIERAMQTPKAAPVQAPLPTAAPDPTQPPRRPGSFLNIVV